MKKGIISTIGLSFLLGISAFSVSSCETYPALKDPKSKAWMADIHDDTSLHMISMPGSHDTAALHHLAFYAGQCQEYGISYQLACGVRMFDIRLQLIDDDLWTTHGPVKNDYRFHDVLDECIAFLDENPSETIVMSIKKESGDYDSTISFADAVDDVLGQYGQSYFNKGSDIPLLKDVRKKITFISRFPGSTFGIEAWDDWKEPNRSDNTFDIVKRGNLHVQDYYKFDQEQIDEKISEVRNCLSYTSSPEYASSKVLTLNFLTGYYKDYFPTTYAPAVAKTMNVWAKEHMKEYSSTGIVLFDFVNEDLAKTVWSRNF